MNTKVQQLNALAQAHRINKQAQQTAAPGTRPTLLDKLVRAQQAKTDDRRR